MGTLAGAGSPAAPVFSENCRAAAASSRSACAGLMVICSVLTDVAFAASVTVTEKLEVPVPVGVPVIWPPASLSPAGSVPEVTAKL